MANDIQTNGTHPPAKQLSPEQKFGNLVEGLATKELARIASTEAGKAASARVALAFRAAARSAQDPSALYNCDASSVAACIVYSALYNLMPGGQFAPVYLVPKGGVLGWWLSHRGVIELARRAGYRVVAKPHFKGDDFHIEYGLAPALRHVPADVPHTWDNLVGVYVIVFDQESGRALDYLDMPKAEIQARRNQAGTGKVWNAWPIEMAIKSAVKYAAARGIITLGDASRDAMESDAEARDYVDTTATPAPRQIAGPSALDRAIGLDTEGTDYRAEQERADSRERAPVETAPASTERAAEAPAPDRLRAGVASLGLDYAAVVEWLGSDGCDVSAPDLPVDAILADIGKQGRRRVELEAYIGRARGK